MFRFKEHLGRSSFREFPGWWRSFSFASKIQEKYSFDKIIHIESDAFVISRRMAKYIKNLKCGWTVFFCPAYNFPEPAIQIICNDSIPELKKLWNLGNKFWHQSMLAEYSLPFSVINKHFVGDRPPERLEEYRPSIPDSADYVCQAHVTMIFNDKLKPPFMNPIHWWWNKISAISIGFVLKMIWNLAHKILSKYRLKNKGH